MILEIENHYPEEGLLHTHVDSQTARTEPNDDDRGQLSNGQIDLGMRSPM
jgi:hypothetical protein